jgi:hypothetical protein
MLLNENSETMKSRSWYNHVNIYYLNYAGTRLESIHQYSSRKIPNLMLCR